MRNLRKRLAIGATLIGCSMVSLGLAMAPDLLFGAPSTPAPYDLAQAGGKGGPGDQRPPREALDACEGKSTGAACSFDARDGAMSGTCQSPDAQAPAACMPKGGAPKG